MPGRLISDELQSRKQSSELNGQYSSELLISYRPLSHYELYARFILLPTLPGGCCGQHHCRWKSASAAFELGTNRPPVNCLPQQNFRTVYLLQHPVLACECTMCTAQSKAWSDLWCENVQASGVGWIL